MARGTDMAALLNPEHAHLIDQLKDELLIVFLKRLGGKATFTVAEVDDTGRDLLAFSVKRDPEQGFVFDFEIQPKL